MPRSCPESVWLSVGGVRLHARRTHPGSAAPDAPVIVLVHGLGMSSRYMLPLLDALTGRAHVYALDLPGYGRSGDPAHRLDLPELAAALAGWMDSAAIGPATVAGNSLGAQVVVHLALRRPDLVERAVLIGMTCDPASGGTWQHLARLVLDGLIERPTLLFIAARDYLRAGPRLMLGLLREALQEPERAQLAEIVRPTLVVRGRRDPISGRRWNERIARLVARSRLVVVPHAPHAVNFSAPRPLAEEILRFCSEPL